MSDQTLIERLRLCVKGQVPDVPTPTFVEREVYDGDRVYTASFCEICNYEQLVSGFENHGIGCKPLRAQRVFDALVLQACDALLAAQRETEELKAQLEEAARATQFYIQRAANAKVLQRAVEDELSRVKAELATAKGL